MSFSVRLTDSAVKDLDFFPKKVRRAIADAVERLLQQDANVEARRRKPLRANRLASWELRIGDYRVFYDLDEGKVVKIVAVRLKDHNDLYIRGKKVEL
jgi:addiction module RelE/StbE family toxin